MARTDLDRRNEYDQDVVYTGGAKDAQGHSSNIRAHIPDPWVGAIAELVGSLEWPEFTTPQHFYRDAIFHRLRWAANQPNRNSPRIVALIAIAQGQADLDATMLRRQTSKSFVDNARTNLATLLGDNDEVGVREELKSLEATMEHLQDPWRTELQREVTNAERRLTGI